MNEFNKANKKIEQEDFNDEDQNELKSKKVREENKNSPDNFGSLRHQKGGVEDDESGEKDEDETEDLNNEEGHLGEPEYRDPTPPRTNARY